MANQTSGGIGTNQYKIRGHSRVGGRILPASPIPDTPKWWETTEITKLQQILQDPATPTEMKTQFVLHWRPITLPAEPIARMIVHVSNQIARAILMLTVADAPLPSPVLRQLATNRKVTIRCAVAANPHTPSTLLTQLSGDPHTRVPLTVARNPQCPTLLIEQWASGPDLALRAAVGSNPQCDPEILQALAQDPIFKVRAAVASNPNCSSALLLHLLGDRHHDVRSEVLSNPHCPDHIRAIKVLGHT